MFMSHSRHFSASLLTPGWSTSGSPGEQWMWVYCCLLCTRTHQVVKFPRAFYVTNIDFLPSKSIAFWTCLTARLDTGKYWSPVTWWRARCVSRFSPVLTRWVWQSSAVCLTCTCCCLWNHRLIKDHKTWVLAVTWCLSSLPQTFPRWSWDFRQVCLCLSETVIAVLLKTAHLLAL